ncbi:MAG: DinB family protein [Cyclobacteriaceae bacterium]|nr:DinB family protein [Cyclobacteriaceae bacterium]
MSKQLSELIKEVSRARNLVVQSAGRFSEQQAQFKSEVDKWSIVENVEHLVWAEMGGICGIWKTVEAIKAGRSHWKGTLIHKGLPIEEIVSRTWQPKEVAPEIAAPRWGGALAFWLVSLNNCQLLLEELEVVLKGIDPESVIHPHPISGPLDVFQRMEFLRFHLDRHRNQIDGISRHSDFPT